MIKLITVLVILVLAFSVDPPTYNFPYTITYDETFVSESGRFTVNGKKLYDPKNNRQRTDRANGRYDLFCGTVLKDVTTPCQLYTVNNKRWIVYPVRKQCCFCCDSAHGCGSLRPDWLNGAKYLGKQKLIDTQYDKWSKDGTFGYNYFWSTADDEQIPRKLDEGGSHIIEYNTHSFHNQTIPFEDSVFALPAYCNEASPNNCPLESICGKLRQNKA